MSKINFDLLTLFLIVLGHFLGVSTIRQKVFVDIKRQKDFDQATRCDLIFHYLSRAYMGICSRVYVGILLSIHAGGFYVICSRVGVRWHLLARVLIGEYSAICSRVY